MYFFCNFSEIPFMAAKNFYIKMPFFYFVNNSHSYWQNHAKLQPRLDNMILHVTLKIFRINLYFRFFPSLSLLTRCPGILQSPLHFSLETYITSAPMFPNFISRTLWINFYSLKFEKNHSERKFFPQQEDFFRFALR